MTTETMLALHAGIAFLALCCYDLNARLGNYGWAMFCAASAATNGAFAAFWLATLMGGAS